MKYKSKILLFFASFFVLGISFNANAQRCDKQDFCDESIDYGEYDYRMQSSFVYAYPGDTVVYKTVLYLRKQYNVFVCADPELGDVRYKIVKPFRKTVKKIKEITTDTVVEYKLDENGEIAYPEENNYEPVKIGETIERDTVWDIKRVTDEKLIYDSRTGKTPIYNKVVKRTHRVFIYVYVPEDGNPSGGCVNIYVGKQDIGKRIKYKEGRASYVR